MKNNKRMLFLTLMIAVLVLFGCVKKDDTDVISNKIRIMTTVFAPYDFARQIVGDNAEVTMLLPPAVESHSYEPTPQDIIDIQNCDVFVYVGGESDEWVSDVLDSIGNKNIEIVTLTDCVDLVEEEIVEGMEEEAEVDELAEEVDEEQELELKVQELEYDEHVWTSPKNAIKIVEKMTKAIAFADEENKDVYEQNAEDYIGKLQKLDAAFQDVVTNSNRNTIVFGDRFPLRYFADTYDLEYYAAFPGCSTDTEPSSATITFLIDKVKEENIPVVFHIELSNEKMADTICEATGAKKLLFHACHNVSKKDFENGVTYLELMNNNVSVLKEALN
jgi:zinc transport system substrate-binding protein